MGRKCLWTRLILTGIVLGLLWGCGPKLTRKSVIDTYKVEHRTGPITHGVETLVLKANGTYVQTFVPAAKGPIVRNTGNWVFDDTYGPEIKLEDALSVPGPESPLKYPIPRMNQTLPVTRIMGRLAICRDPDIGLYYMKVR